MAYTIATLPGGDLFIRQSSLALFVTANYAGPFTSADGESRPEVIGAMPLHFETDAYAFEIGYSDGQRKTFTIPRDFPRSEKGGITVLNS